jgi:GT2 family glycosyltransferase
VSHAGPGEENSGSRGPRLGIVTVTYNSAEVLPDFLRSLGAQSFADWRLYVIDNASSDSSCAHVEAWGDPRLALTANQHNRGFAAATNQGIADALADGVDWVLILNNDTVFGPDFLARLMARAGQGDAQVFAPRITYFDAPDRNWYAGGHFSVAWGFRATHEGEGQRDDPAAEPERWVSFAPGCCKLVSADLIRSLGTFDESYFVYWEDTDLCWRWRSAGVRIRYLREPSIEHKVSALTGGSASAFSILMYHRNQMLFLRKHFGRMGAALMVLPVLVKIGLRWLLRRDRAQEVRRRLSALRQGWSAPFAMVPAS